MADHLTAREHRLLTDRCLSQVYRDLAGMLDSFAIPATFAFVMAFLLDEGERKDFAEALGPLDVNDEWMVHVAREQAAYPEGWFQPAALDWVRHSDLHEIACHGFCHRSLGDGELSPERAARELDAAAAVAARKRIELETMVFPRNRVGNLPVLMQRGYRGYRTRKPTGRALPAPLANLAEELNVFTPAEPKVRAEAGDLTAIPHGHFFNWRDGNRRLIPPAVTVRRWTGMIDRAAANDQVAHLWLHPHNFITGPGTWQPFERVLAHARNLREAGRLEILTQANYCAALQRT